MNINKVLTKIEKSINDYSPPLAEKIAEKKNPFQLLVSTILSARTRDEVTHEVCQELFKQVSEPSDLKKISIKDLEKIIKPINFYKNKAKYLKELSDLKKVPDNIEELTKIKGVGRKTANIVLNTAFNKPSIAVDTHVHRVINRLGYVKTETPEQTEKALRNKLPKKWWSRINRILVLFGQNTCTPRKPKCSDCPVNNQCPRIGVKESA